MVTYVLLLKSNTKKGNQQIFGTVTGFLVEGDKLSRWQLEFQGVKGISTSEVSVESMER